MLKETKWQNSCNACYHHLVYNKNCLKSLFVQEKSFLCVWKSLAYVSVNQPNYFSIFHPRFQLQIRWQIHIVHVHDYNSDGCLDIPFQCLQWHNRGLQNWIQQVQFVYSQQRQVPVGLVGVGRSGVNNFVGRFRLQETIWWCFVSTKTLEEKSLKSIKI